MKELAAAVEEHEPGALSYAYFYNEVMKQIVVIERWASCRPLSTCWLTTASYKDMEAVKAHRETEHMAEAMKASAENLDGPPKIFVLKALGGFKR